MHGYKIRDATLQVERKLFIPTTMNVPQYCVRAISGRRILHDVNLKFWTVEQFLGIGAPCEISDPQYLIGITQDENRLLFGGPYGMEGEVAFQRLVYTLKKEEEKCEWDRLIVQVEEVKEYLDSDDEFYDQTYSEAIIADMELRMARLSKEPVGSGWRLDTVATGSGDLAIYGLFWPEESNHLLYNAKTIWPAVSGIFQQ